MAFEDKCLAELVSCLYGRAMTTAVATAVPKQPV